MLWLCIELNCTPWIYDDDDEKAVKVPVIL